MASNDCFNILLIGNTGHCKSTIGNFIIDTFFHGKDEQIFKVGYGSDKQTSDPQVHTFKCGNIVVNIIDTPGLYDTDDMDVENTLKIYKHLSLITKINFLIFCCKKGRYDERQEKTNEFYIKIFYNLIKQNNFILLTTGIDNEEFETQYKKCYGYYFEDVPLIEVLDNENLTKMKKPFTKKSEISESNFINYLNGTNVSVKTQFESTLRKCGLSNIKSKIYYADGRFRKNNKHNLSQRISKHFKNLLFVSISSNNYFIESDKINIVYPPKIQEEIDSISNSISIAINFYTKGMTKINSELQNDLNEIVRLENDMTSLRNKIDELQNWIDNHYGWENYHTFEEHSKNNFFQITNVPIKLDCNYKLKINAYNNAGCKLKHKNEDFAHKKYSNTIKVDFFNWRKKYDLNGVYYFWYFFQTLDVKGEEKYKEEISLKGSQKNDFKNQLDHKDQILENKYSLTQKNKTEIEYLKNQIQMYEKNVNIMKNPTLKTMLCIKQIIYETKKSLNKLEHTN